MKHLKTFESLLTSGTTVQEAMYMTELSDNQCYINHADNVDYAIVKKCVVHWSLNISEDSEGLTNLIPMIKKIDMTVTFKVFEENEEEQDKNSYFGTKEVEKQLIVSRNFNIEEFETVVFPFKPHHLELEITREFEVKTAMLEFVPRRSTFE